MAEEFAAKVDCLFDSLKTNWSRGNEDSMGEKDKAMAYWFMKMKQGAEGQDFAKELWQQGLVGVLFGTWRIDHVLDDGRPDPEKLTAKAIGRTCPQSNGIPFDDDFLWAARVFLLRMSEGDRVVVVFDEAIHIGTVDERFYDDPNGPRGPYEEYFKWRPVKNRKAFSLTELPASYRLVAGMGRRAIQGITAYKKLVRLLDENDDSEGVQEVLMGMPKRDFLDMLSDKQWEVICDQYLRDKIGLRSLVLGVGGTLKDVDIYGVAKDGRRVLAQCKNDSSPYTGKRLARLIAGIPRTPEDHLYFCCRGGVEGDRGDLDCQVVDGNDILNWLDDDPDYFRYLKSV
jgi:hypothetical protein